MRCLRRATRYPTAIWGVVIKDGELVRIVQIDSGVATTCVDLEPPIEGFAVVSAGEYGLVDPERVRVWVGSEQRLLAVAALPANNTA